MSDIEFTESIENTEGIACKEFFVYACNNMILL